MVGNAPRETLDSHRKDVDSERIGRRLDAVPGVAALREALDGERAYLVGGAVRDLLLGGEHPDLDIAVEGDAAAVAARLGGEPREHERFATASTEVDGVRLDLASTRTETYEHPGALPVVEPASIDRDLARRDFTVNAMAVPLTGEPVLLDPHGGVEDLRAGLLRVLHERSFSDDPTRALRAARYAARLGLELEPRTAELLAATDLGTVSEDRVRAELRRIAAEPDPAPALELLAEWGLAAISSGAPARVRAVLEVLGRPGWSGTVDPVEAAYRMAITDSELEMAAVRLSSARPAKPSEAVRLARGRSPLELLVARVAGGRWLDDYITTWRDVELEIDGEDLLAAGVPEGRAIGRGLSAALEAKLDGEAGGREDELRIALSAAGS